MLYIGKLHRGQGNSKCIDSKIVVLRLNYQVHFHTMTVSISHHLFE